MSILEVIYKLKRFVCNPRPYFELILHRFLGCNAVIVVYRKCLLPRVVRRVRRKKIINVVFLAMNPDMWRYDGVYRQFMKDKRFNPIVVTAMRIIRDKRVQLEEQSTMESYFSKQGYSMKRGFDVETHRWINLKELAPDIIFYTQPYNGVINASFEYSHHLNSLLCYAPYSFQLSEVYWNWDNNLQQYCWRLFYVGDYQIKLCSHLSRVGKSNAFPAGYCFEEEYAECLKDKILANGVWKNDKRKRIIWAPHHSIMEKELFKVSSFLEIAELMLKLRDEYASKVLFAFKPHPMLKTKLYAIWGECRTNEYYENWASSCASFDAQGDYCALFAGSDAMIHCSGSFIVEYLYTGKPVAYVYSKTRTPPNLGEVGSAALDAHYSVHCAADIRHFIDDVVIGGHDVNVGVRKVVATKYLRSPNGETFSENVYKSIVDGLQL